MPYILPSPSFSSTIPFSSPSTSTSPQRPSSPRSRSAALPQPSNTTTQYPPLDFDINSNFANAKLIGIPRRSSKSSSTLFDLHPPSPSLEDDAILASSASEYNPATLPRAATSSSHPPFPPSDRPTHKPISSGKLGALRLNIEAIKRTLSEPAVAPSLKATTSSFSTLNKRAKTEGDVFIGGGEGIIRKKSGELVKPSLKSRNSSFSDGISGSKISPQDDDDDDDDDNNRDRIGTSKSAPSTPSLSKFVHFDSQLEHVKLFLAEQRPLAVSRDGSPTSGEETTGESEPEEFPFPYASSDDETIRNALSIRLSNLPSNPKEDVDVRLESISLSEDARSLRGSIIVRNITYSKFVAARFSLDLWQTTSEVSARYVESLFNAAFDRFRFEIKLGDVLPKIVDKCMEIAVRYCVEGREYWDNNAGENYRVLFIRNRTSKFFLSSPSPSPLNPTSNGPPGETDQIADLRRQLEKVVVVAPFPAAPPPSPAPLLSFSNSKSAANVLSRVGRRSLSQGSPPRNGSPPKKVKPLAGVSKTSSSSGSGSSGSGGGSGNRLGWKVPDGNGSTINRPPSPTRSTSTTALTRTNAIPFPKSSSPQPPPPLLSASPQSQSQSLNGNVGASNSPREGGFPPNSFVGVQGRNHRRLSYFDSWPLQTSPPSPGPPSPRNGKSPPSLSPPSIPPPQPHRYNSFPPSLSLNSPTNSMNSTPSITTSSSPSTMSPLSPPELLSALGGGVKDDSYSFFLDRFCFYTGRSSPLPLTPTTTSSDPRRTHSTSSIEDFFTSQSSYTYTISGSGSRSPSGVTTPTREWEWMPRLNHHSHHSHSHSNVFAGVGVKGGEDGGGSGSESPTTPTQARYEGADSEVGRPIFG